VSLCLKIIIVDWECSLVVEKLTIIYEALDSSFSTAKNISLRFLEMTEMHVFIILHLRKYSTRDTSMKKRRTKAIEIWNLLLEFRIESYLQTNNLGNI
jgi:hypothetical protein